MHVDDEGVTHPITLAAETESADLHFASCDRCGSRWAGPFGSVAMAQRVAELANESGDYVLPAPVRKASAGLCCGPDGVPVGTPAVQLADEPVGQARQLAQAGGDIAKGLGLALLMGYGVVRGLALFTIGAVRFVIKLGAWGALVVGGLALVAFLALQQAAPYVPDPATSAHVLLAVVGALVGVGVVVVLARGLRASVAEPEPVEEVTRTDYSTPLTTAQGASSVSPVSKTPAGEVPKG